MIKKTIFIYLFLLLFLPNIAVASETTRENCSLETIPKGQTSAGTCLLKSKQEAFFPNCGDTLPTGKVCCCNPKTSDYTCRWKTIMYVTDTSSLAPGGGWYGDCDADETKGIDCDPSTMPETNYKTRVICCCPEVTPVYKKADFIIPEFQIPIDTSTLTEVYCTGPDNSGQCEIPWIAEYIQIIYQYGLGVGGILAAIVLMAGGVLWLVSAGDVSKISQAKDLIIGSITGLIILFGTYLILSQINPELTTLKSISVKMIDRIIIQPIKNGSDSTENISDNCADVNSLVTITDIVESNAETPMLDKIGKEGLIKAVEEAKKQGVELYVTSAFRTAAHQQRLWDDAMAKYKDANLAAKYVARPGSCGGHRSGRAIDVCIKDTASCQKMGSAAVANYSDEDVVKLKAIMKAAGWQRYRGEWWHFQYQEPMKNADNS
ncbi:MAG TPA: D-alanyl-D-alanine carboxypeptidase family protein [bacterium]|nr:D-alanyl-D-alanine carboxypeptidase family protein [bacterium]HPW05513.1 D-alanyl-D-alanine carboxypeptidase family protein [bacterium]